MLEESMWAIALLHSLFHTLSQTPHTHAHMHACTHTHKRVHTYTLLTHTLYKQWLNVAIFISNKNTWLVKSPEHYPSLPTLSEMHLPGLSKANGDQTMTVWGNWCCLKIQRPLLNRQCGTHITSQETPDPCPQWSASCPTQTVSQPHYLRPL